MDWQTYTALGIVFLTLLIFAYRLLRSRKNRPACGGDCGCDASKKR